MYDRVKRKKALSREVEKIEKEKRVYVDESGIDTFMHRSQGCSPRGIKLYWNIPDRSFARESFIAAQKRKEILAPICYNGMCNAVLFNMWPDKHLIPELRKEDVIIMEMLPSINQREPESL